jgi:hypothetical protein
VVPISKQQGGGDKYKWRPRRQSSRAAIRPCPSGSACPGPLFCQVCHHSARLPAGWRRLARWKPAKETPSTRTWAPAPPARSQQLSYSILAERIEYLMSYVPIVSCVCVSIIFPFTSHRRGCRARTIARPSLLLARSLARTHARARPSGFTRALPAPRIRSDEIHRLATNSVRPAGPTGRAICRRANWRSARWLAVQLGRAKSPRSMKATSAASNDTHTRGSPIVVIRGRANRPTAPHQFCLAAAIARRIVTVGFEPGRRSGRGAAGSPLALDARFAAYLRAAPRPARMHAGGSPPPPRRPRHSQPALLESRRPICSGQLISSAVSRRGSDIKLDGFARPSHRLIN